MEKKMKILSCLCSYKGCLSSRQANEIIQKYSSQCYPEDDVSQFPLADGGEGTLSCLSFLFPGRKIKEVYLPGPLRENRVKASYGILDNTMVIEVAQILGLSLNPGLCFDKTTSYGLGLLLKKGREMGFTSFLVGLGGSAIADEGAGARKALGFSFFDKEGKEVFPVSGNLLTIERRKMPTSIDTKEVSVTLLCDVKSTLFGKNGATYLFSGQKGAEKEKLPLYEKGRKHLNHLISQSIGKDVSSFPSSGAAGGLGAFFQRFFKTEVTSGASYIREKGKREERRKGCDFVLLGEGHTDKSTLQGKSLFPVLQRAKKRKVKGVLLSGIIDEDIKDKRKKEGVAFFSPLHSCPTGNFSLTAKEDLKRAYSFFRTNINKA